MGSEMCIRDSIYALYHAVARKKQTRKLPVARISSDYACLLAVVLNRSLLKAYVCACVVNSFAVWHMTWRCFCGIPQLSNEAYGIESFQTQRYNSNELHTRRRRTLVHGLVRTDYASGTKSLHFNSLRTKTRSHAVARKPRDAAYYPSSRNFRMISLDQIGTSLPPGSKDPRLFL